MRRARWVEQANVTLPVVNVVFCYFSLGANLFEVISVDPGPAAVRSLVLSVLWLVVAATWWAVPLVRQEQRA